MMARKSFVFLVVGTVIFFLCSVSSADVPDSINYQGKLTTASGGCLNDTVQMTFTIYSDDQGTSDEWSETQTEVEVKEGIFNVFLGSVNPLPASLFDGSVKYLGVQVESDDEMRPLKPMVSVPYAYRAGTADGGGGGGWVDDGTVVRLESGTDSVGIGTASPASKLEVNGNVEADGFTINGVPVGTSTDSYWSESGGNIYYNSGNVGIGTTNPQALLQVGQGTFRVLDEPNRISIDDETPDAQLEIATDGGTMDLFMLSSTAEADGDLFIVTNNGTVGIGTSAPTGSKLVIWDNDATSNSGGLGLHYSGGVGGTFTLANGQPYLMAAQGKRLQLTTLDGAGTGLVINNREVGIGTTTPSEKLDVDGNIHASGTITSGSSITIDGANDKITATSGTIDFDDENIVTMGDVGIGTMTPAEELDVNGTVKMTGFDMPAGAANGHVLTSNAAGVGTWQEAPGNISGGGTPSYIARFTDATTIGDAPMYYQGNGGIFLETPLYAQAGIALSQYLVHQDDPNTYIEFQEHQIDIFSDGVQMITADETTQDIVVINEGSADVDFRVESNNDANALFVRGSDGLIGIGTSDPTTKLHVAGETVVENALYLSGYLRHWNDNDTYARFTTDQIDLYAGNTWMISADAIGAGGGPEVVINRNNADVDFRVGTSGESNALVVDGSTGYVGIGTTEFFRPLQVLEDRDVDPPGEKVLTSILTDAGTGAGLFLGYYADGFNTTGGTIRSTHDLPLFLGTSAHPQTVTIADDGDVGIGTTNPQRSLHISDVMRLEPRAAAPAGPSEGDIYVNSTDHHIYCYLNGVWKQLDN